MSKPRFVIISGGVLLVAALIFWQQQQLERLSEEGAALRERLAQQVPSEENLVVSKPHPNGEQPLTQDEFRELLRLRGQVSALRDELAEARTKQAITQLPQVDAGNITNALVALEEFGQQEASKAGFAKGWMKAFIEYAMENQGQFPTNFDQAFRFLDDETKAQTNVTTEQFEIVYRGSRDALTNSGDEDTLILRERQARQNLTGKWGRVYGRVDGSALTLFLPNPEDLARWENERLRNNSPQ